jgi:hypothetical protein
VNEPLPLRFFKDLPLVVTDPCSESGLQALNDAPGTLLRHPHLGVPDNLIPKLIDLRNQQPALINEVIEHMDASIANRAPSCVIAALSSEWPAVAVAQHLARQTVQRTANGRSYLIRFWDPWVLMHLQWIWSGSQLHRLTKPTNLWVAFVRGERLVLANDALVGNEAAVESARGHAIHDIGILNQALQYLQWTLTDISRLGPALWSHVQIARTRYALHHADDLAVFAAQAEQWSVGFAGHEEVARALEFAQDGETHYTDALAQIAPARWAAVERELSTINSAPTELAT